MRVLLRTKINKKIKMIRRGLLLAKNPMGSVRGGSRVSSQRFARARRYTTANAPSTAASTSQSQASMLATITTDLDKIAPRFEVQPEQIEILRTPSEFFETLKVFDCFFFRNYVWHKGNT